VLAVPKTWKKPLHNAKEQSNKSVAYPIVEGYDHVALPLNRVPRSCEAKNTILEIKGRASSLTTFAL
jgi:hypothetical protein